jgi:hypothetical protein
MRASMLDVFLRGRELVFESPVAPDDLTGRLRRELAPPVWRLVEDRPQLFVGTFENDRFHMARLVRGRNSFRPMIEGVLRPSGGGTRIEV